MPLTPQQADLALKEKHVGDETDIEQRTIAAISRLPPHFRKHAYAMVCHREDGTRFPVLPTTNRFSAEDAAAYRTAFRTLLHMPLEERAQLLYAFFPRFPHIMAHWVSLIRRLPYQLHWGRKGYRAPHRDELYLDALIQGFGLIHGAVSATKPLIAPHGVPPSVKNCCQLLPSFRVFLLTRSG